MVPMAPTESVVLALPDYDPTRMLLNLALVAIYHRQVKSLSMMRQNHLVLRVGDDEVGSLEVRIALRLGALRAEARLALTRLPCQNVAMFCRFLLGLGGERVVSGERVPASGLLMLADLALGLCDVVPVDMFSQGDTPDVILYSYRLSFRPSLMPERGLSARRCQGTAARREGLETYSARQSWFAADPTCPVRALEEL